MISPGGPAPTAVLTEPLSRPVVIGVEGKDDKRFFEALASYLGLGPAMQILAYNGTPLLGAWLRALTQTPGWNGVRSLGVVRDADTDPNAALTSVRTALTNAGLPAPTSALSVVPGTPSVQVMIVPDASTPGELEDLVLRSLSADPVMPCVDQYFECVDSVITSTLAVRSKARVYAYIASRPDPRARLGEAAEKGYVPLSDASFAEARAFLSAL